MDATHWIFVADDGRGGLLQVESTAFPAPRVVLVDVICAAGGWRSRDRFPEEVAVWLETRVEHHDIERITVCAPRRFLVRLRAAWSPRLAVLVHEREFDAVPEDMNELDRCEAIAHLLTEA